MQRSTVGEEHHMKQRVQQVGKDSEQKRKQISHDGSMDRKNCPYTSFQNSFVTIR